MTEVQNTQELKKKPPFARLIIVLLVIAVVCSALLGIVNEMTYKQIDEIAQQKTEASMKAIQPDADEFEARDVSYDLVSGFYEAKQDGQLIGYCVETTPNGFGGEMTVMVGFDAEGTITGVTIVSNSETPNIGSKTTGSDFLNQYIGKSETVTLNGSDSNSVDAISGATISSRAVTSGVNAAIAAISQEVSK